MIAPKEKAKDLVDKLHETLEFYVPARYAKQCALIAVDEILNNDGFTKFDDYLTEYWKEVKQEIEKI